MTDSSIVEDPQETADVPWANQKWKANVYTHSDETGEYYVQATIDGERTIAFVPIEDEEDEGLAHLIAAAPEMAELLADCHRLFETALPEFDWGRSALSADAIKQLNDVPIAVRSVLDRIRGDDAGTLRQGAK